jgi:xylulokinase
MTLLGLDIGSSSVKTALLKGGAVRGKVQFVNFPTRHTGACVEVKPEAILKAVREAIACLGPAARTVDAIVLSVMSPSWVAMDKQGKALTPVVTHQDRRSVAEAEELERRVGKRRHLRLAGNRPFPGGISSTTWTWFGRHHPDLMRRADLVGHLNTFLHRQMTGARVTEPSNASFMGVYLTLKLGGWSDELLEAVGGRRRQLPEVLDGNVIAGTLSAAAARRFGLAEGTPMTTGLMDGSCGMLLAGANPGQLLNVSGSTDVLALCTDRPKADEQLLTRALGIGRRWLAVSTVAAAGSSLSWIKDQCFVDHDWPAFNRLTARLARRHPAHGVRFKPYLAGQRTSIQQQQGAFEGLTLSTTREDLLSAVIESLAQASAQRIPLLQQQGIRMRHHVLASGARGSGLGPIFRRDWPGRWHFKEADEVTMRGLAKLHPRPRR